MPQWFTDARGIEWEVWEVRPRPLPADRPGSAVAESHPCGGWLCFESATYRRHLARYPRNWESLPPHALAALCETARPQPPFALTDRLVGVEAW